MLVDYHNYVNPGGQFDRPRGRARAVPGLPGRRRQMSQYASYEDRGDLGWTEPEDVLSPRHYTAVRRGGRLMRSLPLWCYTGEKFAAAEKGKIFLPSWHLMEREEVVPNPGDYHTMDFLGAPLIVTRGKDEKVRVFANTCRHRGARLVDGDGNCKAFRCPY